MVFTPPPGSFLSLRLASYTRHSFSLSSGSLPRCSIVIRSPVAKPASWISSGSFPVFFKYATTCGLWGWRIAVSFNSGWEYACLQISAPINKKTQPKTFRLRVANSLWMILVFPGKPKGCSCRCRTWILACTNRRWRMCFQPIPHLLSHSSRSQ